MPLYSRCGKPARIHILLSRNGIFTPGPGGNDAAEGAVAGAGDRVSENLSSWPMRWKSLEL